MKRSLLVLLGIFFCLGHASSTSASPLDVSPTCKDLSDEQQKALNTFHWSNNDPAFKPDFCDPENAAYRVAKALLLTKSVGTLNGSAPDKFDQGFLSSDPFQFFSKRIHSIQFEPESEDCTGTTNAYVDIAKDPKDSDGVMHVCQALAKLDDNWISSALIHEARHVEGYHHVECDHGFFTNSHRKSCDESYSSGGSYAIQAEYLVKISRFARIDPSVRQSSRAIAIELLVERFNKLPLDIRRGAVLLNQDSEHVYQDVLFYNGETATPLLPRLDTTDRLFQTNGYLKVYNTSKWNQITFADGITPGPIQENIEKMGAEAGQYLDTYSSALTICNLFTHGVHCYFSDKKVVLPINDFTPVGFWSYAPLNSSDNAVRIKSKEGRVYTFSADSKTFESVDDSSLNAGNWNENAFILLGPDGKIVFIDKKTEKYSSDTPGLDPNSTFTKMITPFYWSKELQEL
jgi:hypothetical protein